ncbi:hypothetical protein [Falsigemmobacter intermedius]
MVGREEADKADAKDSHAGLPSQFGTPWGTAKWYLMSPLGVPCQEPSFGGNTPDLRECLPHPSRQLSAAGIRQGPKCPGNATAVTGIMCQRSLLLSLRELLRPWCRARG